MNNKYRYILLLSFAWIFAATSCSDYFEEPIVTDITIEDIYSDTINARTALNSAYYVMPFKLPYTWGNNSDDFSKNKVHQSMTAAISDEAVSSLNWGGAHQIYYPGALSPLNVGTMLSEYYFRTPYLYIRRAMLFIDNVGMTQNASEEFIKSTTSEAQMLIALAYFDAVKRLGSVPWVESTSDEVDETRLPLKTVINRIDSLILEAIPNLPTSYNSNNTGRVNKASAYFLRSRLWLLAASPLFNRSTPVISMDDPANNNLICMGSEDPSLWIKAATVTKEAIDYCESNGYSLVNSGDPIVDYTLATRDLQTHARNTEAIMVTRQVATQTGTGGSFFFRHMIPSATKSSKGCGACSPTLNFVEIYDTVDKSEVDLDTESPWDKLDPRFHASVVCDRSVFGSLTVGIMKKNSQSNFTTIDKYNDEWVSGFFMRKYLHEEHTSDKKLAFELPDIIMRLPELYLNYAEALNESSPGDADIMRYLNKTRDRVGMWNYSGTAQDEVRELIIKERAIEFAFEDQRYFDLRRWVKGEIIGETKYGVVRKSDGSGYTRAEIGSGRQYSKGWEDKYYFNPFPEDDIQKGFGLIQNPGY